MNPDQNKTSTSQFDSKRRFSVLRVLTAVLVMSSIVIGVRITIIVMQGAWQYFTTSTYSDRGGIRSPEGVRELTAEMTDIDIPSEFLPIGGRSSSNSNEVTYRWCPGGACEQNYHGYTVGFGIGELWLYSNLGEYEYTLAVEESKLEFRLQSLKRDYTRSLQQLQIRGEKCVFSTIHGQLYGAGFPEIDQTAEALKLPEELVLISGVFPGKKGKCRLVIQLLPEDYDQAKILAILRSIR